VRQRAYDNAMKIITVATHAEGYFALLRQTCLTLGYDLRILGWRHPWRGLVWRLGLYREYLETCPAEEIVVCLDGYDTLALAPPEELESKFSLLGEPFLCSGQRLFSQVPFIQVIADRIMANDPHFMASSLPDLGTPYRRPCCGAMVGRARRLREIFSTLEASDLSNLDNDQILMTRLYLDNPGQVPIDARCSIFQNLWKSRGRIDARVSALDTACEVELTAASNGARRLRNSFTGEQPCLLHAPRNLNMNPLLRELGYEPTTVSLGRRLHYFRYSTMRYVQIVLARWLARQQRP